MGRKTPPLATIGVGSEALKGATLKTGKAPSPGGRSWAFRFSGTLTVLMKLIAMSSLAAWPTQISDDEAAAADEPFPSCAPIASFASTGFGNTLLWKEAIVCFNLIFRPLALL